MGHDSVRHILQRGLPLVAGGLILAGVSLGVFVARTIVAVGWLERPLGLAGAIVGALGSGVVLTGAAVLVRARPFDRTSPWLVAFFATWLGELVLRLWSLASSGDDFALVAARVVLAAVAAFALARGIRAIWLTVDRDAPWRSWSVTARAFGVQLAGLALVPAAQPLFGVPFAEVLRAEEPLHALVLAASWVLFAGPWVHLLASLRRSIRWVHRPQPLAEILGHGPSG